MSNRAYIEMLIKIAIVEGDIKKSVDIAIKNNISPTRYGTLVKQVSQVG